MLATVFFTSSLSLLLLIYFTDWTIKIMPKINVRLVYGIVTVVLLVLLYVMGGGWMALGVAAATTCVGLIPVFYSCRRSHCMAVLLVPIALNMAGYGDAIARLLGLM